MIFFISKDKNAKIKKRMLCEKCSFQKILSCIAKVKQEKKEAHSQ